MGHDHEKKKQHDKHDDHKKKKREHEGHDGKLSDAIKNRPTDDRSADDETTPGYQEVTPDMPTNIDSDVVAVDDLGKDPYNGVVKCKVTANVGAKDGVIENMKAYVVMKGGEKLEYIITEVRNGATVGEVEGTTYNITHASNMRVVFNPK